MTLTNGITGFALSLSLILAIGAQNAFVLRQGLRKEHVFLVCSICAVSDAVLILFGVFVVGDTVIQTGLDGILKVCLLYTSPSPRDLAVSRMPSSA